MARKARRLALYGLVKIDDKLCYSETQSINMPQNLVNMLGI